MYSDEINNLRDKLIADITKKFNSLATSKPEFRGYIGKYIPFIPKRCKTIKEFYLDRVEFRDGVLCGVVFPHRGSTDAVFVPLAEIDVHLNDFYTLLKIADKLGI